MIQSCAHYHDETSYDRHHMTGHYLDWANQPDVYKDYPGIKPIGLPRQIQLPKERLSSLLRQPDTNDRVRKIDLEMLSRILLLTYSLTAKARHPGGDFYYRSAASAGALYPTEIYVASHAVNGLYDGLYHFAIHRHGLFPLRRGDLLSTILSITQPEENKPLLTFFLSAIFFRSAWKYRARSYRYHLLDTGHVAENLTLALKAQRVPFSFSYDFDDWKVNHLLGLDEGREVSLAVAHVFGEVPDDAKVEEEIYSLPSDVLKASRVSGREVDYPAITEMHQAGTAIVSRDGPQTGMIRQLGVASKDWTELERQPKWPEVIDYPEAIFQRRSRRNFVKRPLTKDAMAALLEALCAKELSKSGHESAYDHSLCTGFLVRDVEGMEPGFYLYDPSKESISMVASGPFVETMTRICLDQLWLANAAVHVLFLTNLDILDRNWGPRGYRYAMMNAGRLGERLYIAATAMELGCCGIGALYDGEAAELLGLNRESRLLYLVAVGPIKRV
ncbi:MAG: SagB/ThcOx family dehydrogenase [Desulfobacteraceae bacterium]|jgi:SagB-type dehydrogenase family enzyme